MACTVLVNGNYRHTLGTLQMSSGMRGLKFPIPPNIPPGNYAIQVMRSSHMMAEQKITMMQGRMMGNRK